MSVAAARFSLEHYEHMVDAGVFDGKHRKRVELLNGEIVEMPPVGPPHADDTSRIAQWSYSVTCDEPMHVRTQLPIRIPSSDSEPEPDFAWVEQKSYRRQHPEPGDVLLVIEIAESSLDYDRGEKLAVYAEAGIPEYWIVNLLDSQVEVYREPSGGEYQHEAIHRGHEAIHPLALPAASLVPQRVLNDW